MMNQSIQLFFSPKGRSVKLAHPLFQKPKSLRLSNADRSKVLDLVRQRQLRKALLFIESLLLLQTKEGAK